ncbi:hypothetical protein QEH42_gp309 [Microbacterium phage Pumpernickel]|uniref:Uncharacterized protein n=1 Tax=Microbacterium phage Pumpernickel TaxID=2885983 RepID=A0AAE8Y751_9CAUD|nr:hypothetical protein QEH42_gp309 [Microbacterium phage Pumpernickel]UDL15909.1 hypothetical protein SEA_PUMPERNICKEL_131 [Microbacterium phage Pumpernickel]
MKLFKRKNRYVNWIAGSRTLMSFGPYSLRERRRMTEALQNTGVHYWLTDEKLDYKKYNQEQLDALKLEIQVKYGVTLRADW